MAAPADPHRRDPAVPRGAAPDLDRGLTPLEQASDPR